MSAHIPAAMTLICLTFGIVLGVGGDTIGAIFLGFVGGGWFIKFVDEVWP